MITAAVLGLSTSYIGGIEVPILPYFWPDLGFFQKKKFGEKPVRIYMDGCFDLMHYGHANALRQAKALGDELVVGVVSDEEIIANKGPPVLSMEERLVLVSGLKWVDEVIANAPYAITETVFSMSIRLIILYLEMTLAYSQMELMLIPWQKRRVITSRSSALRVSRVQILLGPGPDARVVYIDGAFDLFHAGHVEILKHARQLGDFLRVGIRSDQSVSECRGTHHPIMNLHERSLSVLACRYVE
ncbi:hypothetical protein MRB53_013087 [Persea americana]|uniref:Uncharacterized protein n=1 Tax=Persea americana TaxID=3435 RepID=A0ACC2K736_PERAE|nr:hypothetical protein MRB53_013087 [Persea americana]